MFGYGSLMWRPGFDFEEASPATLAGYHRSLCVYSHHYRGTPERPGLVFGLRTGGQCDGIAFRVAEPAWAEVLDYLRARELITGVYVEVTRPVVLESGEEVTALTYVADPDHQQFADLPSIDAQRAFIEEASGWMGSNRDYVLNTIEHLTRLGIEDEELSEIGQALK